MKSQVSADFSAKLERQLKRAHDQVQPIDLSEADPPKAIYLDNYVTTVHILKEQEEQEELLNLKNIGMAGGASCKLTPTSLPACVNRFGRNSAAGNTTALISEKGKILVVGANGYDHARLATQEYRLFIESVPMLLKDPVTQKLRVTTLEGRTRFEGFGLWNVVSHTNLGVRPDLKKLSQRYPKLAEWDPELFPGCIFRIYFSPKKLCQCKPKKKTGSCACNCTVLVFDTGKCVVTGTSSRYDALLASECVRRMFNKDESLHFKGAILPSHLRYDARKKYKMESDLDALEVEFLSMIDKKKPNLEEPDLTSPLKQKRGQEQQVKEVLQSLVNRTEDKPTTTTFPPFIQACLTGQIEMVKFMFQIHGKEKMLAVTDDEGRNALAVMEAELTEQERDDVIVKVIMEMLQSKDGPSAAKKRKV